MFGDKSKNYVIPEHRRKRKSERFKGRDRFVYFIYSEKIALMKIGVSAFPVERMAALNTVHKCGVRNELQLVGLLPGGFDREREVHKHFAEFRFKGEWFRVSITQASEYLAKAYGTSSST